MICLDCKKLELQQNPKHAGVGLGKCKSEPIAGTFVSVAYERSCPGYEAAGAEIAGKRREWYGRKG